MANPDWVKGVSGNPGGRIKNGLREYLRGIPDLPEAIFNTVYPLLNAKDERVRMEAAEFLRDSTWGKPAQMTVMTDEDGKALIWNVLSYVSANGKHDPV